mmetsp:Transcript_71665/g.213888  ORF Transcript_71665/g.213888 Transcript_71665/m.213888 type:complete len:440 (-) Transcript_71665:78-1397(-)
MPPPERVLAPIVVLCLHTLLLIDVAAHRKRLLDFDRPVVALEWSVAAVAVLTYLRTVISDPGFLQSKPAKPSRLWPAICALVWFVASGFGLAALWRRDAGATSGGVFGTNGSPSVSRNPRDAHEARELQPIGRSVLDAVGGSEAGSDPGEEAITTADLEIAAATPTPSAGTMPHPPPRPGNSLGLIPGSPRPGAGRNRAKAREVGGGRWANAAGPGGDAQGADWMQSGHRLRYCRSCSMYQPLRTKHCRDCGRCVRTHDHHCPWVGTCVGEGNRIYFYWFLVAQFAELLVFSLEGCAQLMEVGFDLTIMLNRSPMLLLGLVFMVLLLFMVSCLLVFHSYLAMTNMTTWENISWHNISYLRSLPPEDGSPFSLSLRANLVAYCCPPWCPAQGCGGPDPVKRTEDGWAVWELGDPHAPLHVECTICGLRGGCIFCHCFSAG